MRHLRCTRGSCWGHLTPVFCTNQPQISHTSRLAPSHKTLDEQVKSAKRAAPGQPDPIPHLAGVSRLLRLSPVLVYYLPGGYQTARTPLPEGFAAGGIHRRLCAPSPALAARAAVERLGRKRLPAARVTELKTARDGAELGPAGARARQGSQTPREERGRRSRKFRRFLFSASIQLRANGAQVNGNDLIII